MQIWTNARFVLETIMQKSKMPEMHGVLLDVLFQVKEPLNLVNINPDQAFLT